MNSCAYCHEIKHGEGWHSCKDAQAAKCKLLVNVMGIHSMIKKPGNRKLTSNEMRERANRLSSYAVGVRIRGGEVRPEYRNDNQ